MLLEESRSGRYARVSELSALFLKRLLSIRRKRRKREFRLFPKNLLINWNWWSIDPSPFRWVKGRLRI